METVGGRYARQWASYRGRSRTFWIVVLGYPLVAGLVAFWLRDIASPALPLALIIGYPLTIFILANSITSWPCPQCGKSFFYVHPGSRDNVFTVRACGYCGLPKWGDTGGTPPGPPPTRIAITDATRTRVACWFCGRANARGRALELNALDLAMARHTLTIPRCRKCAFAHALEQGHGAALLGMVAFGVVGWLYLRGIDESAGFGAAMMRFVPFALLAFIVTVAAILLGLQLSRLVLWGSRPLDDWTEHPEVQRYKEAGWNIWHFKSGGIDTSTT
jgi:hypothetical protein